MKDDSDPIRISPGEPGRLIVRFPYTPERVASIRGIPGRRWHVLEKFWTVPDAEGMAARLRALLAPGLVELASPLMPDASRAINPAPDLDFSRDGLLQRIREAVRARHFSPSTEKAYVSWAARFLGGHQTRRPEDLGEAEIGAFLSSLASEGHVSASTQNQALNALLFLYQRVLGREIGLLDGVVRAKRPHRLPVVLSREEVRLV